MYDGVLGSIKKNEINSCINLNKVEQKVDFLIWMEEDY